MAHYKPWEGRQASLTKQLFFNVLQVENGFYEEAVMDKKNPTDVSLHAHTMWQQKVEYDDQVKKANQAKKAKKAERKRKNETNEREMGLRIEERGVDIPSKVSYKEGDNLCLAAALLGKPTTSPQGGE